ncbi:hypothetical protein SAMN05720472_1520 [Fibrobacter sp. UWR3]|uniref:hypothetical protein n=1 Tax=Fibrobacter sp. UWR3 TaxID=1896217 RepID=UPI00091C39B8|nr:hypothetical protein [Fibrobacter sp. UWR3]SHM52789.1 hypothetical protein SAMN05720472_1520 [Fibrobacter sp. UWR3]
MKYGKMMAGVLLLWSLAMVACSDDSSTGPSLEEILAEYSVAYEFDDPANVGEDFFGNNNAVLDEDMPAVKVEDGTLVLDGTSGLRIPLSDSFKSYYFAFEVRFMPTDTLPLSNIFSADPPGSGVSGWMLRLDGSELNFHIRHGSDNWTILSAGNVSLNEWHVARVEFRVADAGGLAVEEYDLTVSLDGKVSATKRLSADVADLKFDLGIGYDPHHQSRYEDRFFIGKIDYIRYGNR